MVLLSSFGRHEGHPACKKTEWWGAGVVICLERGADLHMAQLMPLPLTISCISKIQIGFIFLVLAHLGSPGNGPLNGCVCVCLVDRAGGERGMAAAGPCHRLNAGLLGPRRHAMDSRSADPHRRNHVRAQPAVRAVPDLVFRQSAAGPQPRHRPVRPGDARAQVCNE